MPGDGHGWLYFGVFTLVVHAALAREFTEFFLMHISVVAVGAVVALVVALTRRR